jgi:glycosyltransferase involved in cell wall biosynthesis
VPHPEVTIVIPTRDRPGLLAGAVASALAQTVRAIEVLVVDDGSAEPPCLPVDDDRLRLLRLQPSQGVCAARNRGLAAARGRFVTFLDDDDRLLPTMVERSLQAILDSTLPPPVAALSALEDIDSAGRPLGSTRQPVSLARGRPDAAGAGEPTAPGPHATLVVPTQVLRAIGGWDQALRAWEHTDLFLRLRPACSVQAVHQIGYRRSIHPASRLSLDLAARVESMQRTLATHHAVFARHPSAHARYLGAVGIAWLRMGRWGPAVAATTAALRIAPARPRTVTRWLASLAGPRVWTLLHR